jgi:hypothetical protein
VHPLMGRRDSSAISRRTLLIAGTVAVIAPTGLVGCAQSPAASEKGTARQNSGSLEGVVFTSTGATFSPVLELAAGATAPVIWRDEAGSELARGTSPTIAFGSAGIRRVVMATGFADVLTVNLGFNSQDDGGKYSLDSRYNKQAESVSGVSGLGLLTNLRRFLAGRTELGGSLDVSGLDQLEHIECYDARLESADLTRCNSLVRLCVEQNRLRALDLNPVAASLRDLRAAGQESGALEFAPLEQPLARLYHFCVRDQVVKGHPDSSQLPVCEELWNWNCAQTGRFPTPGVAHSVLAAGNSYTSVDLAGQWTYEGGWGTLDLTDNRVTTVTITGCRSLQTIRLGGNALSQDELDKVLAEVASWGTKGFEIALDGRNSPPSPAGLQSAAALRGRGWKVVLASP